MSLFLSLKLLHVVAAIVAVGANMTYPLWYARLSADTATENLRTLALLDNRVANPAYGVALVTGVAMAFVGDLWSQAWIHIALTLFVVIAAVGAGLYSPTLRRQIAAADTHGFDSAAFRVALRRGNRLGGVLSVLVVALLVVMVFKPTF